MWISGNVEIDEEVPTRILEIAGNGIVIQVLSSGVREGSRYVR